MKKKAFGRKTFNADVKLSGCWMERELSNLLGHIVNLIHV